MSSIPEANRLAVLGRAYGLCERCHNAGPLEIHHRKYRSRGGTHDVSNLVAVCGWGNHTGCHGWTHTQVWRSTSEGWTVRSGHDPLVIPVLIRTPGRGIGGRSWVQLTNDGDYVPLLEVEAQELRATFGLIDEVA